MSLSIEPKGSILRPCVFLVMVPWPGGSIWTTDFCGRWRSFWYCHTSVDTRVAWMLARLHKLLVRRSSSEFPWCRTFHLRMRVDYEFGRGAVSLITLVDTVTLSQPRTPRMHRCVRKASYPDFDVPAWLILVTGLAGIETIRCVPCSILILVGELLLWIVWCDVLL